MYTVKQSSRVIIIKFSLFKETILRFIRNNNCFFVKHFDFTVLAFIDYEQQVGKQRNHGQQYYMHLFQKTRRDMCCTLNVPYTTFTDWVKAKTYPRIDKIEMMANYFGISKADLVEERPAASSGSGLTSEQLDLLKSLSKADLDIVFSVARQMKQKETQ